MAKKNNEAKIKFTAETGEFNKALQNANDELSSLRAELKLNETQMKATGVSVEGLEEKHSILQKQLDASERKTEALNAKVEKAVEIFGENSTEVQKLRTQLVNAQTAEERARQAVNNCNRELEDQARAAEEAASATAQLTDRIDEQQAEVNRLKDEYIEAVLQYGKTSDEAKKLAREIKNLSGDLADSKREFDKASTQADRLDKSLRDAGDGANDSADGFTIAKGAIADLAANAISAAISKLSDFIGYLAELPEATRELRQDMATLDTSFAQQGLTTEQATATWKELYKVFGEDDRAVEAANLIAKMSDNQKDLNDWVNITTGIWGSYQDSLPVEGLAEASNETAKTGKVTGVLADALNWSSEAATMFAKYMSEDVTTAEDAFNEALAKCTTEQERQTLITETLTKLYGGAADEYREAAGAQMEAKEATAENTLVQAELGETLEPLTTEWDKLKSTITTAFIPAAQKLTQWGLSALEWMREHPKAMTVIATTVGIFAGAITALAVGFGVYTAAQWLATSALWAFLAPILPIVAGIAAVVAAIVAAVVYWDELVVVVKNVANTVVTALQTAWDWVKATFSTTIQWINTNVIQPIGQFFVGLWNGIATGAQNAWNWVVTLFSNVGNWVYTNVISPVVNFFVGMWTSIVSAYHTVIDPWIEIFKRLSVIVNNEIVQPVKNFFNGLWNSVKNGISSAWNWAVNILSTVSNWVNTKVIQPVYNFFNGLWNGVINGVRSAVAGIKTVFSTVKAWFHSTVIQPVKDLFTSVWNSLKSGASSAWSGIKSVFSSVASFFRTIFTNAWTAVKNVFSTGGKIFSGIKDGIITAFKSVVNTIIKGINKVVSVPFNGLNNVLNRIAGLEILKIKPFSWLTWRAPVPQIPLLAQGGIVNRPTLNIAGEGGEAEAIIPISKLQTYISSAIERTMQNADVQVLAAAVQDLANRPIELNINGRQFAVATASDGDTVNGLRSTFKSRGLIVE